MPLYRIECTMAVTAYVRAGNAVAALALCEDLTGEPVISGLSYDDPKLPALSISPAMTLIVAGDLEEIG